MNEVLKGSGNPQSLTKTGWHILREEVSFPVAVLSQSAISNNAKWMSEFCQEANVNLAPHGKTTMAPELFKMQLEHGAWGITLATVAQVLNAANHGVTRIILANQLVGKYHFEQIAQLLETTDVEFYCFVDSVENAKQIGAFFDVRNTPINILLEIGTQGGRCGWRDVSNADAFLAVCEQHPSLKFSGIGFYEGSLGAVTHSKKSQHLLKTFINWHIYLTSVMCSVSLNPLSLVPVLLGTMWLPRHSPSIISNKTLI